MHWQCHDRLHASTLWSMRSFPCYRSCSRSFEDTCWTSESPSMKSINATRKTYPLADMWHVWLRVAFQSATKIRSTTRAPIASPMTWTIASVKNFMLPDCSLGDCSEENHRYISLPYWFVLLTYYPLDLNRVRSSTYLVGRLEIWTVPHCLRWYIWHIWPDFQSLLMHLQTLFHAERLSKDVSIIGQVMKVLRTNGSKEAKRLVPWTNFRCFCSQNRFLVWWMCNSPVKVSRLLW